MDLSKAKAIGFEIPTWQEALHFDVEVRNCFITNSKIMFLGQRFSLFYDGCIHWSQAILTL